MTFSTITIADGQATPVNHDYVATSNRNGVYEWLDMTASYNPAGSPVGFGRIQASLTTPKQADRGKGNFVLDIRHFLPTLETVSNSTVTGILPAPTHAYDCVMFVKYVVPARSSLQNRKDLHSLGTNALLNGQIKNLLWNYVSP